MVDGRVLKMLCVIDEYIRERLAIEVGASLRSQDVIPTLSRLMRLYGASLPPLGTEVRVHGCNQGLRTLAT